MILHERGIEKHEKIQLYFFFSRKEANYLNKSSNENQNFIKSPQHKNL